MTGCFGGKTKISFELTFGHLRAQERFNGVRDGAINGSHASYESIALELDIIMKPGFMHIKAGEDY